MPHRLLVIGTTKPDVSLLAGTEIPIDLTMYAYGYFHRPSSVPGEYKDFTPSQEDYKKVLTYVRQVEERLTEHVGAYNHEIGTRCFGVWSDTVLDILSRNQYLASHSHGLWTLTTKAWSLFGLKQTGYVELVNATWELNATVTDHLCLALNDGVKTQHGLMFTFPGDEEYRARRAEQDAVGKMMFPSIVYDLSRKMIVSGMVLVDDIAVTDQNKRVFPGSKLTILGADIVIPSIGSPFIDGMADTTDQIERRVSLATIHAVVPDPGRDVYCA